MFSLHHGIGLNIDFFSIGSGNWRHKFIVPPRPFQKRTIFNFILDYTHLEGTLKIFMRGKKDFSIVLVYQITG